ncbi:hypothetical protein JT359_07255 [Candidatus Poribacteria bacterium]|nr:hypothetical protein [Candidatus Poribacteria bacterium]
MEHIRNNDITEENISLWHKCTQCSEVSFRGELKRNGFICPKCKELFPLSLENRHNLLLDIQPTDEEEFINEDNTPEDFTNDVLAIEENIGGHSVSLFILQHESILEKRHIKSFSEAILTALDKSIPLLSVFTANPVESKLSFPDIVPLLLQLEKLSDKSLPYITVLTETGNGQLRSHLPVGEIVIAECTSELDNTARTHPQPALHAPEEQLLPEKNRDINQNMPDISVDTYVPRSDLHMVIARFLKFFSSSASN